jgi:tetratricopeptide (TPR) repeat protein
VQTELARTHNEIGNVRSARFEFGKAHESHRHALSVLQSVPQASGLTEVYRYELARTLYFLASKRLGAMGSGRYGEAGENVTGPRPHYYKSNDYRTAAVRILDELTRAHPGDPDYRFLLGLCQRLTDVGPPAARSTTAALGRQRATTILEELTAAYPDVADYRYELAVTYGAVPVGLFPGEDRREVAAGAEQDLRRALDESQWLVAHRPTIPEYARFRSVLLAKMGMVCWRTGRLAEAEDFVRKAIETQSAVIREFPDLPPHHRDLLDLMRLRLGQVQMERGDGLPARRAPPKPSN